MKNLRTLLLLIVLAGPALAVFSTGWHDAGLLTMKLSNYGTFASENAAIWPRGTSESYIFGAGIWVGGLVRDTAAVGLSAGIDSLATSVPVGSTAGFDPARGIIRIGGEYVLYRATTGTSFDSCVRGLAASRAAAHSSGDSVWQVMPRVSMGYDPSTGNSEFAPGDLPNEPGYTDTLDRVYFSDNPADTALWPVRSPGGDAIVVSNEDSYNISNDLDTTRHINGGLPLGVKVVQEGYAWYYHYYEDFIFLTYLIVNPSATDSLKGLFAGLCCDADIGDATDDLAGSDAGRNLGYAWDSNFFESGWAHVPGYIGFDFLESPQGPSGQLGLTAYKILHNPGISGPGVPDPANDLEAFLTLAGYDHPTGQYHPVDSMSLPTDVRFCQCTGPFQLGPGDTGRVVIAVIYGADSNDLRANSDLAQRLYDSHFITHRAWVDAPNGGENIAGDYTIRWRDSSATGAPLLADIGCSHDRGRTWRDIVTNIPSTHSYVWHTDSYPDGTRYLVRVTVHDSVAVGEDVSDSIFTVNNPGNGVPDVEYLSPQNGTVRGPVTITWSAADPDGDSLACDLLQSLDGTNWDTIQTGLANTGSAQWNSRRVHNGAYYLAVRVRDRDTWAMARSGATVQVTNDHAPAGYMDHVRGGADCLSLLSLTYDSLALDGHTYEVGFAPIVRNPSMAEPYYRYTLTDVTAGTVVESLVGLDIMANGQLFTQYGPIHYGFGLEFDILADKSTFRFNDFHQARNRSGFNGNLAIQGADSLGIAPPLSGMEWCPRGSEYRIRWVRETPPDSLTLEVYDSTNQSYVPYSHTRGDCWQLGSGSSAGRYFNPATQKVFYLDGGLFWFNQHGEMTIPPDSGDVWVVGSAGPRVPVEGNIWRFRATLGVEEAEAKAVTRIASVAPNPLRNRALVRYSLAAKTRVTLAVFDITGRRVRTLFDGVQLAGPHSLSWDGADNRGARLAAGVYFVTLVTDDQRQSRKVVLTGAE